VTAENISKAESEIQRLTNATKEARMEAAVPNDVPRNAKEMDSASTTPQDGAVDNLDAEGAGSGGS